MSYVHLNARERMNIFYLHQWGLSLREIGRRLNRSHTTISRELHRNKRPFNSYYHGAAQYYADQRKAQPRHQRRYTHVPLRRYVRSQLRQGWSPQIIAHRIGTDHPRTQAMRISTETIYRWVYQDAQQVGTLHTHLIRGHKKRKKQCRYGAGRRFISDRIGIEQRPIIVASRRRFGDWEGDTMVGYQHQGRIVTQVERKSRYLLAAKAKDGTATSFNTASMKLFQATPKKIRKTLTLDNGSENANFKQLENILSFKVYFAKPYASWERGTNENTNGLLRRTFPKGTNFLTITKKQLDRAVHLLNHRPRKCLNYRTPHEVFYP